MIELTQEYTNKGFYLINSIPYKNREFLKCGNIKDDIIYFFEIKNNKIINVIDDEILKKLEETYIYISEDKIY